MSVQLAKTQSGNNTTPGRRTPSLSLSQQAKTASGNKSGGSPAVNSVAVEKNDKHEKSSVKTDTGSTEKLTTKSDLNEKRPTDAAVEQKKDEILQENGYTNGHKRNDSKDDDKKSTTDTNPVRGSPRNKEKTIVESPKKAEKVSGEKTRKKNENKEKNSEEAEKKKLATEKNNESVETKKTNKKASHDIESAGKKDEKKSQETVADKLEQKEVEKKQHTATKESKKSQDAAIRDSRRPSVTENQLQLTKQKSDDMEPLVFEVEGEIAGQPDASSTPGKVLKHIQGPLHSEEKRKEEPMASTVTTSKPPISAPQSFHRESPTFVASSTIPRIGRISGRRSIRNLPEVSFENRYAGSYRQIPDDDRWPSSMNVTVGSEIPNESASTTSSFSFLGRGKKRERTPPINQIMGSQESELSPKSPKRARLDFSGLFGLVASPMTMLRAKFSRTKIQSSSTPNSKGSKNKNQTGSGDHGDGNEDEEDVVNVSGIVADEEITAVEAAGDDDDVIIVDDVVEGLAEEIEKDALAAAEKLMSDVGDEKQQIATAASSESVANKRKMCNVM